MCSSGLQGVQEQAQIQQGVGEIQPLEVDVSVFRRALIPG